MAARSVAVVTEDQIRLRAYQIFEARGGAPGSAEDDWAQARRELLAEPRVQVRRS